MQVMAMMAKRNRNSVLPRIFMILPGPSPRTRPETRAARKQPVPVAVSQLKSKRAASAAGFATTGAVLNTRAWR